MDNPFTADLTITRILSTITAFGIPLGSIDTSTGFHAGGKQVTNSPELDLLLNMDPSALFTVTRALAVEAGEDPAPLDGIVELGDISYMSINAPSSRRRSFKKRANQYTGFNLISFVDTAFAQLKTDVQLQSDISIGDYQTSLQYVQKAVPAKTDDSLHLLLPILAQPIVQKLVAGVVLGIDSVIIINPQETSFSTQLKGSITNAGPFDATISIPSGLTVSWNENALGTISMPDINVVGAVGAVLDTTASFQVADVDLLTEFTKVNN